MLSERMYLLQIYQKYDKFFRRQTIFALRCNLKVKDVQALSLSGEETLDRYFSHKFLYYWQLISIFVLVYTPAQAHQHENRKRGAFIPEKQSYT